MVIMLVVGLGLLPWAKAALGVAMVTLFGLLAFAAVAVTLGLVWRGWRRQQQRQEAFVGKAFDLVRLVELPAPNPVAVAPAEPTPAPPPRPPARTEPLPLRLRQIDWFQFEKLTAALYRAQGFTVTRRGGAQPDGGVDLVAVKAGETTVVQCKHWQNALVKPDKIRETIGAMTIEKAHRATLVTLRGYTEAARQLAREQGVELIGEAELVRWLRELEFSPVWPEIEQALDASRKTCPRCEHPMVLRHAKAGANAGGEFWGCSTYPRCSYTLEKAEPG